MVPPFYVSVKYAARQIVIADILLNDFCFVFCPNAFVTLLRCRRGTDRHFLLSSPSCSRFRILPFSLM